MNPIDWTVSSAADALRNMVDIGAFGAHIRIKFKDDELLPIGYSWHNVDGVETLTIELEEL